MSVFSELLRDYVKRSGNTILNFSKLCGIERSLVQKYLSGSRIPANPKSIYHMAEVLQLSPKERNELVKRYYEASVGVEVYEQRTLIHNLIRYFRNYVQKGHPPLIRMQDYSDEQADEIVFLKDGLKNWERILWMLESEIKQEEVEILLIAQPEQEMLMSLISYVLGHKNVKVHHIVCLENRIDQLKGSPNLKILFQLLPNLFRTDRYRVSMYYDNLNSHRNDMSIFPNIMLTNHSVVCFDNYLQSGILYHKQEVRDYYQGVVDHIKKECHLEYHVASVGQDIPGEYVDVPLHLTTIHHDLCMMALVTREEVEQFKNPEFPNIDEIVDMFWNLQCYWRTYQNQGYVNNIITRSGIDHFVQEGKTDEIPDEFYIPIPVETRIVILKRLVEMIENGSYMLCIAREGVFNIDDALTIELYDGSVVKLVYQNERERKILKISELSIVRAIEDYIRYIPESRWMMTQEETLQYVKQSIVWLEQRVNKRDT